MWKLKSRIGRMNMIEVMLIDDHKMVREGMKQLLEFDNTIRVVAEGASGIECLELLQQRIPDVLLLDINMPDMNGIEVVKKIRKDKIPVKILILTVHKEVEYLLHLVDLGIEGYILKDSGSTELMKAIEMIANNEKYIQPELIPVLNSKLIKRDTDKDKIELLTDREIEVLKLVAEGKFNKEIASQLKISERTVKNHISNIFKKIDVSDRTQAAVVAIRNNIINLY